MQLSCYHNVVGCAMHAGNYITPSEYRSDLGPSILLQDSFTDAGPQDLNTRR